MVICITGMHRSHTSLTTSWLSHCGLTIHDGRLIASATGNTKGHFEDSDFVRLHSSVIKAMAPRSKGWKYFTQEDLKFTGEAFQQANDFISTRNFRVLE